MKGREVLLLPKDCQSLGGDVGEPSRGAGELQLQCLTAVLAAHGLQRLLVGQERRDGGYTRLITA